LVQEALRELAQVLLQLQAVSVEIQLFGHLRQLSAAAVVEEI
jgi:hypothetical protein